MSKFAVKNVGAKVVGFDVLGTQYTLHAGDVQGFDSTVEEYVQAAIAPFGSSLEVDYSGSYLPKGGYGDFYAPITLTDSTLIAAVAAGDLGRNAIRTADGKVTYFTNINAQTLTPTIVAGGLDIGCDQTAGDGIELDWGLETVRSSSTFVANPEPVYFKHKVVIDTVANADLVMGFRKAEAVQKDFNDYDEMVALRLNSGALYISSILNGGATSDTDTTDVVSDGDVVELFVAHDQRLGLAMACTQANEIKASLNLHMASFPAHTTAPDTTNTITAADATSLATLIVLVNQIITKYEAHEDDAELVAGWLYHAAQGLFDYSLASTVPVVGLQTAIAMLKDMKTKINAHIADVTAHSFATTALAAPLASSTYFKYAVNGGALSEPTVISQFSFDPAEKIVPFIQYVHVGSPAGAVVISERDYNLL